MKLCGQNPLKHLQIPLFNLDTVARKRQDQKQAWWDPEPALRGWGLGGHAFSLYAYSSVLSSSSKIKHIFYFLVLKNVELSFQNKPVKMPSSHPTCWKNSSTWWQRGTEKAQKICVCVCERETALGLITSSVFSKPQSPGAGDISVLSQRFLLYWDFCTALVHCF